MYSLVSEEKNHKTHFNILTDLQLTIFYTSFDSFSRRYQTCLLHIIFFLLILSLVVLAFLRYVDNEILKLLHLIFKFFDSFILPCHVFLKILSLFAGCVKLQLKVISLGCGIALFNSWSCRFLNIFALLDLHLPLLICAAPYFHIITKYE